VRLSRVLIALVPPVLALVAAACAPRPPVVAVPPAQPAPAQSPAPEPAEPQKPATAVELGTRTARFADIPGWAESDFASALAVFGKSCAAAMRRSDTSGLTTAEDWAAVCRLLPAASDARMFFEANFTPVAVGTGNAFVTGYFEPEIAGARTRGPGYLVPVYGLPDDLVRVDQPDPDNPGKLKKLTGRLDEAGAFQLYWDRRDIDNGALIDRNLEIAWAADPIEFFFLQIQGSGRLRLPDGSIMRIGYAGQNGREYVGIGRRLREMNVLAPGEASMEGIMRWLRANPDAGRELMHENKSYVFFKELTGEGPLGAMGAPVTAERSLAADPRFVPLGAPVWLETRYTDTDRAMQPFRQLMVAQDTGGAIKGANRFDLFWGAGARARAIAGGLSSAGRAFVLIPNSAARRIVQNVAATN
jgi:membrane-bound lytic murein transglycosylase A